MKEDLVNYLDEDKVRVAELRKWLNQIPEMETHLAARQKIQELEERCEEYCRILQSMDTDVHIQRRPSM